MKLNRIFCIANMDVGKRHMQGTPALPNFTPLTLFNKTAARFILALLVFSPTGVFAANTWSYHQESDRLTNKTYSFAQSPLPSRGLYDYIRLEVICKENTLQVAIDADSLIASQGRNFGFEYQIDNKPPVTLQMTTFKDTKRRGYTEEYAQRIVNDMLIGKSIFIRVNTMIRKVLSAEIPLENGAEPIRHVVSDCGLNLSDNAIDEPVYTLSEFQQDFDKLPSELQQQVLNKIKIIIMETQNAVLIDK
ncbi:MAG: hypothetical protein ACU83U_15635 [Gammaproteobacteria bacterium]